MSENNYTPPQASLEDRGNVTSTGKLRLYELAVCNQALMRLYPMLILSYIFPPLLVVLSGVAIFFVFRVAKRMYGGLLAILIASVAFLPLLGLLVIYLVSRQANKRIDKYGFRLTMDKQSLDKMFC